MKPLAFLMLVSLVGISAPLSRKSSPNPARPCPVVSIHASAMQPTTGTDEEDTNRGISAVPPAPLPATLWASVFVGGVQVHSAQFDWDGTGWMGIVDVGGSGRRPVYLNLYRGQRVGGGQELFGWTVSPIGSKHWPASAFYGRQISVSPVRIEVDVSFQWKRFAGDQPVVFVFTS